MCQKWEVLNDTRRMARHTLNRVPRVAHNESIDAHSNTQFTSETRHKITVLCPNVPKSEQEKVTYSLETVFLKSPHSLCVTNSVISNAYCLDSVAMS